MRIDVGRVMPKRVAVLFAASLVLRMTFSIAAQAQTSAYDDCILKNMRGVTSDEAAKAIQLTCLRKAEQEAAQEREREEARLRSRSAKLSSEEGKKVRITWQLDHRMKMVAGKIYNANDGITLTKAILCIVVVPKKEWSKIEKMDSSSLGQEMEQRKDCWSLEHIVHPLSNSDFTRPYPRPYGETDVLINYGAEVEAYGAKRD